MNSSGWQFIIVKHRIYIHFSCTARTWMWTHSCTQIDFHIQLECKWGAFHVFSHLLSGMFSGQNTLRTTVHSRNNICIHSSVCIYIYRDSFIIILYYIKLIPTFYWLNLLKATYNFSFTFVTSWCSKANVPCNKSCHVHEWVACIEKKNVECVVTPDL